MGRAAIPARSDAFESSEPDGSLLWRNGPYAYDGAGNIKSIGSDDYSYDVGGRLTRSIVNNRVEQYGYDAFGNLTVKFVGSESSLQPLVDPATNRIAGAVYDAAGNMSGYGGEWYTYDAAGMMTSTNYGTPMRYVYTADDERILTEYGSPPNLSQRAEIRDFEGRVLRRFMQAGPGWPWEWQEDYIYRGGAVAVGEREEAEGGRRYFHLDHLGSTRLLTDASGMRLARHDHFPFGVEESFVGQESQWQWYPERIQFTGHERDFELVPLFQSSTYLHYMHARFYNPNWGRFLTPDPVLGDLSQPQSWNRYAYVMNEPIGHSDPRGMLLCPFDECGPSAGTSAWSGFGQGLFNWLNGQTLGDLARMLDSGAARQFYRSASNEASFGGNHIASAAFGLADATLEGWEAAGRCPEGIKCGTVVIGGVNVSGANTLAQQLTVREAMAGAGRRIMQGGIKDPRFPEHLFAKMEHVHRLPSGTNLVVHYWRNLTTGVNFGFKLK